MLTVPSPRLILVHLSLTSKGIRYVVRCTHSSPIQRTDISLCSGQDPWYLTASNSVWRPERGTSLTRRKDDERMKAMTDNRADLVPSSWDPALDAVIAAPKHHKVLFENARLRVLE